MNAYLSICNYIQNKLYINSKIRIGNSSAILYLSSSFPHSSGQRFRREHSFLISAVINLCPEEKKNCSSTQPSIRAVSENTGIFGSYLLNQMLLTGTMLTVSLNSPVSKQKEGIKKKSTGRDLLRANEAHVYCSLNEH